MNKSDLRDIHHLHEIVQEQAKVLAAHIKLDEKADADLQKGVDEAKSTIEEAKRVHTAEALKMNKVMYGDKEAGEMGMKEKVDEMHKLLVQAQNVGGFFTGIKSLVGWLLVIGAFIALMKGWLSALVLYLIKP